MISKHQIGIAHNILKMIMENTLAPVEKNTVRIRGIITPADWDERGNVIGLAISTFDEKEYLVENNRKGEGLYSFIRKEVEVSGVLKEMDGKKRIEIKNYYPKSGKQRNIDAIPY